MLSHFIDYSPTTKELSLLKKINAESTLFTLSCFGIALSDVEMEVNLAWQEEEESSLPEGLKWTSLTHKGPLFPPEYEPLPDDVR